MRQADVFLNSEGDAWLERNRDRLGQSDPVAQVIETAGIRPKRVLEVGCANGWRLAALRDRYGCEIFGVEPSRLACIEAAARRVPAVQCSASNLAVAGPFDMVIYGFCLYLTDPSDWLRIASEGDGVLIPGGHLIIHDFAHDAQPFARRYEHLDALKAYHFDFAKLWLGHPLYRVMLRGVYANDEMITVLRKDPATTIRIEP